MQTWNISELCLIDDTNTPSLFGKHWTVDIERGPSREALDGDGDHVEEREGYGEKKQKDEPEAPQDGTCVCSPSYDKDDEQQRLTHTNIKTGVRNGIHGPIIQEWHFPTLGFKVTP